jgi:hypothetical protein
MHDAGADGERGERPAEHQPAPREADLLVGPGRDRPRTASIVPNLGGLLIITRFCPLLRRDRRLGQRKWVRRCGGGMLF